MFKKKKTALYMRFATSQQARQKTVKTRLRALATLNDLEYDAEMEQSTGVPSTTVHRALGLIANEDGQYGDPETLDADLVLVDEVSMLDVYLAEKLFRSVPATARLILVGDSDQLPSVGPGAVLKEIIASDMVPVVRLDQVFRQKNGSRIAANAKLIRHGNLSLEYGPDFEFYDSTDLSVSAEIIESLYLQETAKYGIDNVVLLSPYRPVSRPARLISPLLHSPPSSMPAASICSISEPRHSRFLPSPLSSGTAVASSPASDLAFLLYHHSTNNNHKKHIPHYEKSIIPRSFGTLLCRRHGSAERSFPDSLSSPRCHALRHEDSP